jgi:autotransporter-associated beta strand protein
VGGTLTISATGTTQYGIQTAAGSFVSFGAMSVTARGAGAYQGAYIYGAGTFKAVGNITIDSATSGGQWGLDFSASRVMQSTTGNIDITATGNFGMYLNGSIVASTSTTDTSETTVPATGGSITISATGRTQQGLEMVAGSLIANNGLTVTGSASGAYHGVYIAGTGSLKAVGDIAITATTAGAAWAFYQTSSRFIQSTTGNISITSTAAAGYGMYMNDGGLIAGNNTTTPSAGGTITINSSSSYNDINGAALRLDGASTKIIAYGDISIYANGASLGLNGVNQQGHGIILWGGSQVIRSYNGAISMTGYANRTTGSDGSWAYISGGITFYSGGVTVQAKGNVTLNGVSSSGLGLYLTFTTATGGGIISDEGNVVMNGLSNNASYGGAVIRLPITATLGSVTISASGQSYAYYQDNWYGSVSAKTDVNIIGYAEGNHAIYLGIGSVTSSNGNIIFSGYTTSTNTGHYGIYSNGINATASNGSVTFQASQLDTVSTLANAIGSRITNTRPDPYFAIADSGSSAIGASRGLYWTGNITANTSNGQINFYSKAPYVSGVMTAYGLLLGTTDQSYSLTGANAVISVLAGSIGTGSLSFQTASNLSIGSLSSVDGFTGTGLTITSTATLSQTKAISVSTLTLAGTNGVFDLSLANTISTSIALNSGTLKVSHASALGTASAPITLAANSILLSNVSTLALSNPITMSGAATINAPSTYTLTLSAIISSTGNLTINSPTTNTGTVIFTGANIYSGTTTISAGTLQIGSGSTTGAIGSGSVTNNGALIFNRSNNFTVASLISGTGSMTKEGSGALTLNTGQSTYSGGTTVNAGTLILNDIYNNANGVILGVLNVNANGIVQLTGYSSAFGWSANRVSTLNINGGLVEAVGTQQHIWNQTLNFSGGGTFRSNSGTSSASATSYWEWGGVTVNVSNPTAEAVIAGRIHLRSDGTISTTVFTVADGVATNDLLLSAAITEASAMGFTKAGAGTMTVSGASTNTGAITVNAGTLAVTNATGLGTTAGGVTVASGATLDLRNITVGAEALTVNGGTIATSTGTSSLSGTVALGANSTVSVAGTQLTLSGIISGTGFGITKTGNGILVLSAANTYTGATVINAGTLLATNSGAVGTSAGGVTIASGATLALQGGVTIADAITVSGNGVGSAGAILNNSGANTVSGLVTLGAASTVGSTSGTLTFDAASGNAFTGTYNLTFAGAGNTTVADLIAIASGTLTKTGAGTLTLSGLNTYTGATTISAGLVKLGVSSSGANSPLGTVASGLTVADGAALDLAGYSITTLEPMTLSGTGVSNSGALYNSSTTAAIYAGPITLAADTTIKNTGALTLNGAITGAFALTVTNTGLLTLGSTVGALATPLTSLSVSGASNLYGSVWTSGAQTYTGNLGIGNDINLNSTSGGVALGGTLTGLTATTLLYETTTPNRVGNSIVYSVNNSSTFSGTISRITYRMEVNVGGTLYYADVSFDAWANNLTAADLAIPDLTNTLVVQKIVNNMVVSSNQTSGI